MSAQAAQARTPSARTRLGGNADPSARRRLGKRLQEVLENQDQGRRAWGVTVQSVEIRDP